VPRAPRYCARAGCLTLVGRRPYCPEHEPEPWESSHHPPGSSRHRAWRRQVLERAFDLCEIRGPKCTGTATEADHIIPTGEGGAEFDIANGQAACANCHKAKTRAEARRGLARRFAKQDNEPLLFG
jgi:5-methylcytosine-specific restriction protein A